MRVRVPYLFIAVLLTFAFIFVCSCDDDEESKQPSYITELVEIYTDSTGTANTIRLDNGKSYPIFRSITDLLENNTYRCLCVYTLSKSGLQIYSLKQIFAEQAQKAKYYVRRPADPVKYISSWKSDRYLNIKVGVMTTDVGKHTFSFSEDSIKTSANGTKTAYFTLIHERPADDDESYTEEYFLCLPLEGYKDCDSLDVSIPTYDGIVKVER